MKLKMLPFHNSSKTSLQSFCVTIKHWRTNTLWATKRSPKTSKDVALEYFDNIYKPLYGKRWPSMRLALLSPHKYCAVVNNYSEFEKISSQLQNEGAMDVRELFEVQKRVISENKSTMKRNKNLSHVYTLDKKLEEVVKRKREEELDMLYPEGSVRPNTEMFTKSDKKEDDLPEKELIKQAKSSLDQSLTEATIDVDRQIDPSEGFSSSRLNDFVPVSKLKGKEGFLSEAEHFSFFNDSTDFPVIIEREESLTFPSHLKIFTFDQGNITDFAPPKTRATGVFDYYLMNAGSILPVLALGLSPGDTVLDMCAAPGGKSLLCLQTLYPESIVCNDSSVSRLNRLRLVMQQYIEDWKNKVIISTGHGAEIDDDDAFSKILVDVPCTNDRLSVIEDDNNIFQSSRNRERILLPQLQVELLVQALKLVRRGGSVVYSTCSLNPAQNDGVVHMALRKVWEETSMKIVVKDLNDALEPAKIVFQFANPSCLRYGSLVVPYLPANFGPMYFCKLEKQV